jgi:hypothetical protein
MDLVIRKMEAADIDSIPAVFAAWNKFLPQYQKYFEENLTAPVPIKPTSALWLFEKPGS